MLKWSQMTRDDVVGIAILIEIPRILFCTVFAVVSCFRGSHRVRFADNVHVNGFL